MDGRNEIEITPNVLSPLDSRTIASSLSREIVTPARIGDMIKSLDSILNTNGVNTTVNGIPAVVSEASFAVPMPDFNGPGQDKVFYAKAAKISENGTKDQKTKTLPTIVFAETPDNPVNTPNPSAVKFIETFNGYGLLVDTNELDPDLNDPTQFHFVLDTMLAISKQVQASVLDKEAARQAESERKAEQRQAEKLQQKAERKKRRDNFIHQVKKVGAPALKWGGIGLAGGGAGTLIIYGIGKIDIKHPPGFDEKMYMLSGGTELSLGGNNQGRPEYSPDLYNSPYLEVGDVPHLGTEEQTGTYSSHYDNELTLSDTLREIIVGSSKPGKNCSTAKVGKAPLDARLVTWTDFTAPNGASRADELTVLYETDKIKVCWNGEERDELDDPRVVVTLRSTTETQPR